MRKVAVTGMGIVSCLGNELDEVSSALRLGRSGIRHLPDAAAQGLRSQVGGAPEIDLSARIDRKALRFMGDAAPTPLAIIRDLTCPGPKGDIPLRYYDARESREAGPAIGVSRRSLAKP